MITNCKPAGKSYVNYTNWYFHLDKLKNKLFNENPYTLVDMTGEVIVISNYNIPDWIEMSKASAKFVSDIGDNFPIGVFI